MIPGGGAPFRYQVAIPTRDRPDELRRCLASVLAQSPPPVSVIVIDDGALDADPLAAFLAQGGVALIHRRKAEPGLTRSLELAVETASEPWLLILDDDIELAPDFVERCVAAAAAWEARGGGQVSAVAGHPVEPRAPGSPAWRGMARRLFERLFLLNGWAEGRALPSGFVSDYGCGWTAPGAGPRAVRHVPGGLGLWRLDTLRRFRFDPWYRGYAHGVDKEFAYRASAAGEMLIHAPDATAIHRPSPQGRLGARELGRMKVANQLHFFEGTFRPRWWNRACFAWAMAGQLAMLSAAAVTAPAAVRGARWDEVAGMIQALRDAARGRNALSGNADLPIGASGFPAAPNAPIGRSAFLGEPRSILFLADLLERGGIQRILVHLVAWHSARGWRCVVASFREERDAMSGELRAAGAEVVFLRKRRAVDPMFLWRLRRLIISGARDGSGGFPLVHALGPQSAFWAGLVMPGWRAPAAGKAAGTEGQPGSHRLLASVWSTHELSGRGVARWVARFVAWRADAMLFNSEAGRRAFEAQVPPPPPAWVLRYGSEIPAESPAAEQIAERDRLRAQLGIAPGDFVVASVARLVAVKGLGTAIRAVARLRAAGRPARLALVGDGPARDDLEREAAAAFGDDPAGAVLWLGDRASPETLLPEFDVFVLPSRSEGLPTALLEAMAAGLPSVVSPVGGVGEVARDGVESLHAPAGDDAAFAAALARLADDAALRARMSAAARAMAVRCRMGRMVARTEVVYRRVLRGPAPAVGYVVSCFPKLSETFILREIVETRRRGLPVWIVGLKAPTESVVHPDAAALLPRAITPPWMSFEVALDQLALLRASPAAAVAAWFDLATLQGWRPVHALKALAAWPKAASALRTAARRGTRHFHAHWATIPASVAAAGAGLVGATFSFTGHAHDVHLVPMALGRKVRRAAFVTTCTLRNRAALVAAGGPAAEAAAEGKVHLVRYFVNQPGIARRPATAETPSGPCIVLSVGSLQPYKGFEVLLDAFAAAVQGGRDMRLRIVGDGPSRERLLARAARADLAGRVEFLGALPQEAVFDELARADIFALASVRRVGGGPEDNLPTVLSEAALAGVPMIASDLGSIRELIEPEVTGLLTAPGDTAALAVALSRLRDDPALRRRLADAARTRAETMFDIEESARCLMGLFHTNLPVVRLSPPPSPLPSTVAPPSARHGRDSPAQEMS